MVKYLVSFIVLICISTYNSNEITISSFSTFIFPNRKKLSLETVSVAQFCIFVDETNYVTDAEKYGWSIVQKDVFNYEVVENATWFLPDGINVANDDYPVTQVSYNDALAYANWANVKLPDYNTYWNLVSSDKREINENSTAIISNREANIIGNVWDITLPDEYNRIRLAGGSYLCNKRTCDGTSKNRELYVDVETGNSHIGFSIIME